MNTLPIVKTTFRGKICLGGPLSVIQGLHDSAYNHKGIEITDELIEVKDDFSYFRVSPTKALKWRINVEFLKFDVDRLQTSRLLSYIQKKAQQWLDEIPERRFFDTQPRYNVD